jgi:hypothetical protein
MKNRDSRKAVEVAERFADSQAADAVRAEARRRTKGVLRVGTSYPFNPAHHAVGRNRDQGTEVRRCLDGGRGVATAEAASRTGSIGTTYQDEAVAQCRLVRELFNLRQRLGAGRSGETSRLAQAAYVERLLPSGRLDNARLAVLSDALEEAGCTDDSILSHLRSPGPHVRGCWALDLILDRE